MSKDELILAGDGTRGRHRNFSRDQAMTSKKVEDKDEYKSNKKDYDTGASE